MSSNIHGINFDNQIVTAKDHGRLFQCMVTDGIMNGCSMSFSGPALTITPGYFMAGGRQMKLTANTTVTVDWATSGYARVLLEIDLSQIATADTFEQAAFIVQYASTATGFPTLTQEDINGSGTLYQFTFCTVTMGAAGISSIYSRAGNAAVYIPLITTDLLAANAVTSGKLASNAVTAGKLATGAVETAKIANAAITAEKLADGSVTNAKLGAGSVTTDKIADADITTAKIADGNVSTAKIADRAITTVKMADGAVTIAKGGTGSSNGATGLKNLLAAGVTVLSSYQYGTSLPAAGTAGRLFFKKV